MVKNFIELNRSFVEIPKDHTFDEESYDISIAFGLLETKKWSDLIQLPRVIILAEARAGKTEEVRATTKRLRNDGHKAFFFRLEHLSSDFEGSFEIGSNAEFDEWITSDEPGWFFLDSVDEARLCGTYQFEAAIRKFAGKLGDCKQRAHIYITGRLSEWRAQSDLSFITDRLPFIELGSTSQEQGEDNLFLPNKSSSDANAPASKKERAPIEATVFALRPLDQDQIRTFSQAFSIQDIDTFLAAIQKAEAEIFSERPLDLVELINYWKQHGVIANRAKLIEFNIFSKLNETDPDHAAIIPLTPGEARIGAEMLAAAVTFQKKNRILVPDQNIDSAIKTEAVDTYKIFKNWSSQIRALLQRPIFDEAIYGTVRFHHRCVRENLTAKWLHRLLLNGKSRRAIENLFFRECYGLKVLVPSMRPILSWLILLDDRIQAKTAKIAPEIFIQGGDPSALPTDLRGRMLVKFCENYAEQKAMNLSFDIFEVSRFAHPDLGETIDYLLKKYSKHKELCNLLLRIIWQGEIHSCSEKALGFALNSKNDVYTRIYGIHAVKATGSDAQKNKLVNALITDPTIKSEKLIGEIITAFTPDVLCIQDVLKFIQRIKTAEKPPDMYLRRSLREFFLHKCPEKEIIDWIRGLSSLLKQSPVIERRFFDVSQQYCWLLPYAVLAAERLVRLKHPDALNESILEIISLAQGASSFDHLHLEAHALAQLVPKWPELNRFLFWFDVALARRQRYEKKGDHLTKWWQARTPAHYWLFSEEDFPKILEDISVKSDIDDRLVALSLAFQIYKENDRGRARRLLLKKAVRGVPALEVTLHNYLNPPPMSDNEKRFCLKEAYFKKQQKQYKKKRADDRRRWCERLRANTDVLRDTSIAAEGKVWEDTNYLLYELRQRHDNILKRTEPSWEDLIPEFGRDVAEAYRDGCINYWRRYQPQIWSERIENQNSLPHGVIVGLNGIAMEARHILNWPKNLSGPEAKLACRYAIHEVDGFPDWLPKLHSIFPDIVEAAILTEIEWEFSQYAGEASCYYALNDVVWQLDWLKPKISSQILFFLKDYEPKHDDTVRMALEIILSGPALDRAAFIEITKTKTPTFTPGNRQALWLAAWMCVEAKGALETLSSTLSKITKPEQATKLSMLFIIALLGNSRDHLRSIYQDYFQPQILLSLIKLMHKYIRYAEDINRVGSVVDTLELRDKAQYARDSLFQLLWDIPGKPTFLALMDLAHHYPDERLRQWYALKAKRRAEADAEDQPWQAGDIACFAEEAERAPQNHRELFDLTISRLLDLKANLEDGDNSLAAILVSVTDEKKHRIVIGGWLRDNSSGRYCAPQEEELADAKKPDIRIHGFGFDGPVPIELKVVDNNWSGAKLNERLQNQLCGQYLRDIHSNCGIFLLVYLGKKTYWKHPKTDKHLDFHGLVHLLEEKAEEITAKDNKIESIRIIGIDLKKRTTPKG